MDPWVNLDQLELLVNEVCLDFLEIRDLLDFEDLGALM